MRPAPAEKYGLCQRQLLRLNKLVTAAHLSAMSLEMKDPSLEGEGTTAGADGAPSEIASGLGVSGSLEGPASG